MNIELLNATSASNAAFRVVYGELSFSNQTITHPEALFGHVKSGSLSFEGQNGEHRLYQGDLYFISPNTRYKLSNSGNANVEVITVNFTNPLAVTQDYLPKSIVNALLNGSCTAFARISPDEPAHPKLLSCMQTAAKAESEKGEFFQLLVYGKIYEMFYELFANHFVEIFDSESKSKKYRALQKITGYIDEHYVDGVPLDDISKVTGFSRYYISHLFKELMGITFIRYVNELRITRAAMLLTTTNLPIIRIALLSGYNNLSNFNRAFKDHYEKTPSVYRKAR